MAVAAFTTLLVMNETSQEIAESTVRALIGVFSTPFIFEGTCLFMFTVALLTYNQWKRKKEGDDWVYLVTQEADHPNLPASITQRLQGVLMEGGAPQPLDEVRTRASVLEGYLELGMAAQAQAELFASNDLPDTAESAALRLRVLAANPETGSSVALFHTSVESFPEAKNLLVQTALENARWLLKHLRHRAAAVVWLEEAKVQDPHCVLTLQDKDPLRTLLTQA